MNKHTKNTQRLSLLLLTTSLLSLAQAQAVTRVAQASDSLQAAAKGALSPKPNYWYLGLKYFSPMIIDDLSSLPGGGRAHLGQGGALSLGYQFSPLFDLQLELGYGRNSASASRLQQGFYLGRKDAFTYYPYTYIDTDLYYYPYRTNEDEILLGYRGKRLEHEADGFRFDGLESRVQLAQVGLKASINLTRLFYLARYSEKPVELWLRPGLYATHFRAKLVAKQTGEEVAPAQHQDLTLGLGGEAALRFNLHPRFALELGNSLVWQHNRSIDGVASAKVGYDAFVWEPSLGLVYKFGRHAARPQPVIATQPQPATQPAPKLERPSSLQLAYDYPQAVALPPKKERSQTMTLRLTYPLNKTNIVPNLHHNASELARINRELSELQAHPDHKILKVRVEGFASPEGPYENNMRLAEGRARTIIDYVVGRTKWDRALFTLGRMEENWQGLADTLRVNTALPSATQVAALLSSQSDREQLKQSLKQLKDYPALLRDVYPYLRLSSYTVDYELPVYPLPRAKELLKTDPKSLNPEEIYAVALDYGLMSAEGRVALSVLHTLYPLSELSLRYRAAAALEQGQPQQAVALLEGLAKPTDEQRKLLAVAYARLGRYEAAYKLLSMIQHPDAKTLDNLRLLSKHIHE